MTDPGTGESRNVRGKVVVPRGKPPTNPGTEKSRTVRGKVVIPRGKTPSDAAELIIQIEDVSRADAPSKVVGEQRIPNPKLEAGESFSFEIEVPAEAIDDKGLYSVRAHVDVSGSGEVEKGDMLSTQSYPVLTHGYPEEARVEVKRI